MGRQGSTGPNQPKGTEEKMTLNGFSKAMG